MTDLLFIRRTETEVDYFRKEVCIEIDSELKGYVFDRDEVLCVKPGLHTVAMYPVGPDVRANQYARIQIDAEDGKLMTLMYIQPTTILDDAEIIAKQFVSVRAIEKELEKRDNFIYKEFERHFRAVKERKELEKKAEEAAKAAKAAKTAKKKKRSKS